jgi:hypothetical protein
LRYGKFDSIESIVTNSERGSSSYHLTKAKLESKFAQILSKTNPDDTLLFYFSGHGISDSQEKTYLLASDSLSSDPANTGISLEDLIASARKKGLKKVIFVIDACRSSNVTEGKDSDALKSISFKGVDQFAILYSSKLGSPSYEDDISGLGVFTKYLILGLEGKADTNYNSEVSFSELSEFVTKSLKEWSLKGKKSQRPFVRYFGEKSGDIVLTYAGNPHIEIDSNLVKKNVSAYTLIPKYISFVGALFFLTDFYQTATEYNDFKSKNWDLIMIGNLPFESASLVYLDYSQKQQSYQTKLTQSATGFNAFSFLFLSLMAVDTFLPDMFRSSSVFPPGFQMRSSMESSVNLSSQKYDFYFQKEF